MRSNEEFIEGQRVIAPVEFKKNQIEQLIRLGIKFPNFKPEVLKLIRMIENG